MKIGNVELTSPYTLAPMAGFTDYVFREMCLSAGAGLVVTEMVSARGLIYNSADTFELLHTDTFERTAVQIFSNEPDILADCVQLPVLSRFPIIDLNFGCPVPKVVNNGMGSALLRNFGLAEKVIESAVLHSKKPVTVKFRIGWDSGSICAKDFAKLCENAGASAVTVHGRTREQMYSGSADWDEIAKVKKAVKIAVFGNGDVSSAPEAREKIEKYGVDGVAIGRGALGNPWIFSELSVAKFNENRLEVLLSHYEQAIKEYGEKRAVPMMRKQLGWYLKRAGIKRAVRAELVIENDYDKLRERLSQN